MILGMGTLSANGVSKFFINGNLTSLIVKEVYQEICLATWL